MTRKQVGAIDADLLAKVDKRAEWLGQTRRVFIERALQARLAQPDMKAAVSGMFTSKTSGKVYEVRKMRSDESFNLPIYHYRRAGDRAWSALHGADTLAEARKQLNA